MSLADYDAALAFLLDRINYERMSSIPYRSAEFRLDRMRELAARLGDPHLKFPIVHVAGTKGKGSTATMIAAILQAAGYRTGLYTSPHLERVEERFVIDGARCSSDEFLELVNLVRPTLLEMDAASEAADLRGPTFFEATTAMAFLYFASRDVDAAVLEVGLGGRLDSTNVCQPAVSVITSISLDHTRQLGNTLTEIAREKAGIIKPGIPVVCGVITPEAQIAILETARRHEAPFYQRGVDYDHQLVGGGGLNGPLINYVDHFQATVWHLAEVAVSLCGDHQAENAATAIATVRQLSQQGWRIPESAIRQGLQQAHCPARVEIVRRKPTVVLDTAHNVASIEALCRTLQDARHSFGKQVLVFASSRDKDAAGMLRLLLPHFDPVILTRYVKNPRARDPESLLAIAHSVAEDGREVAFRIAPDPLSAWQMARDLSDEDALICITGSFFLAAELRGIIS